MMPECHVMRQRTQFGACTRYQFRLHHCGRRPRSTLPAATLCLGCVLSLAQCGFAQPPDDPIAHFRESIGALDHVEMTVSLAGTSFSSNKPVVTGRAAEEYVENYPGYVLLLRREGDRALLSVVSARDKPIRFQTDRVFDHGRLLYVNERVDSDGRQVDSGNMVLSLTSPDLAGPEHKETMATFLTSVEFVSIVFGALDEFPIVDYVGEGADVQVQPDGDLVHVRARSDLGLLQLWLDPDAGFLPRRLHLVKQAHDRTSGGRRVNDMDMNTSDGSLWPTGRLERLEWSADDIDLRKSGDRAYIHELQLIEKRHAADGAAITIKATCVVDEITFSPEFTDDDFRPLLKIPVGASVGIDGAEHLPYEWDGEKVVPRSRQRQAEVAVEAARKRGGSVSGGLRLPWLIGINAALIAAIAAVLWYQRRAA